MQRDLARQFLYDMQLARRFEQAAAEQYAQGNIAGFLHLYPGEEAVAVGSLRAADPGDYVVTTYREHVHALIRGVPPGAVMAELFGRSGGCSGGYGGSMHLFDMERRFLGGYAIVGETFPIAIGAAYRQAMTPVAGRGAVLLRRRRRQPGHFSRVAEHGRPVEAAGAVHLRKQPLPDRHRDSSSLRRGGGAQTRLRLRHPRQPRRRHGCTGGTQRQPSRRCTTYAPAADLYCWSARPIASAATPWPTATPTAPAMEMAELQAAATPLDHRSVAAVLDHGVADGGADISTI